jgi:hypothetical protein
VALTSRRELVPAEIAAIDGRASVLMKQGIRLMGDAGEDAVAEALSCFDRALEMRRGLPVHSAPLLAYGLAACWLNRAEALVRLGGSIRIAEAVHAYDEAIVVLASLPLGEDARFPRQLAIAHQNRGLALQAQGEAPLDDCLGAFSSAIDVLEGEAAASMADRTYILAAVLTNLASARASVGTAQSDASAREAAARAISLVSGVETSDADAAEVALEARHVMCQTYTRSLETLESADAAGMTPDEVHETTDLVDDGLAVARGWEQKGVTRFRDIAQDLFHVGALVYQRYQPHFLEEFLRENGVSSSPEP